jgi:two-component system response regulator (stage 0 sporulation protein A)
MATEKELAQILLRMGFNPATKGYHYALYALHLHTKEPAVITLGSICSYTYPRIADKFNASAQQVERAIRHAIETAYNANIEEWKPLFGKLRWPTNGQFLATIAEALRLEMVS